MLHGLYFSAQGAQLQSLRQDVLANNLANAATNGFKRDLVRAQAFPLFDADRGRQVRPDHLEHLPGGTLPVESVTDFSQGPLQTTKNPWDIAITGPGFLQVSDGNQEFLTRDGRLAISAGGELVTRDHNLPVVGTNGRPVNGLDPSVIPQIAADGRVLQGGVEVGQLAVVTPSDTRQLQKAGANLYRSSQPVNQASPNTSVRQGYLEASGTRPMTEMMELIESSRGFEANINMVKHQDEALGRLLQNMGRR